MEIKDSNCGMKAPTRRGFLVGLKCDRIGIRFKIKDLRKQKFTTLILQLKSIFYVTHKKS